MWLDFYLAGFAVFCYDWVLVDVWVCLRIECIHSMVCLWNVHTPFFAYWMYTLNGYLLSTQHTVYTFQLKIYFNPQLSYWLYTFKNLLIGCTHSMLLAIECIHWMVIHFQYSTYTVNSIYQGFALSKYVYVLCPQLLYF